MLAVSDRWKRDSYQTAHTGANVEDTPEPSKVTTLLLFIGIGHHDGTLGTPQKTSTNTKKGTSKDIEAGDIFVNGHEETNGVDTVTNATKGEGKANTQTVDKGTSKESNDGKGTVESSVL